MYVRWDNGIQGKLTKRAIVLVAEADCDCMTEPDEHGEERVLIHSLRCSFHPDYEAKS